MEEYIGEYAAGKKIHSVKEKDGVIYCYDEDDILLQTVGTPNAQH